jgi:chromosome segregation ATPase
MHLALERRLNCFKGSKVHLSDHWRGAKSVADDRNENPSGSQTLNGANGKDLLYGWLVGRAAADLGLAQALALSDAQRSEQITRLEESLLGQIHELQNGLASAGAEFSDAKLAELKTQLQGFSERQNHFEEHQPNVSRLEDHLRAKIDELEKQIQHQFVGLAGGDLGDLRGELRALAERLTRAESAAEQIHRSASDATAIQEQITSAVKAQSETLRSQLLEQLRSQQPVDAGVEALKSSIQTKIDDLQQEVRENATLLHLRDEELSELRVRLVSLSQSFDQLASAAAPAVTAAEREAELARWDRQVDERFTARIGELADELHGKLETVGGLKVDRELFVAETGALTARIAQLDQLAQRTQSLAAAQAQRAQQAAESVKGEIAALQTELVQLKESARSAETLLRGLEESWRNNIQDLQNRLAQDQFHVQDRDKQLVDVRADLQTLAQRLKQSEAGAQQAQALAAHETTQLRDGLKAELALLQAQLDEKRTGDVLLRGMEENLSGRIGELQNQLGQKILFIEQRDADFKELKFQVQSLALRVEQIGSAPQPLPSGANTTVAETLGTALESYAPPQERTGRAEVSAAEPPETADTLLRTAEAPKDRAEVVGREQIKQMQERMSADIERVRAELREKSGRWKVRR